MPEVIPQSKSKTPVEPRRLSLECAFSGFMEENWLLGKKVGRLSPRGRIKK